VLVNKEGLVLCVSRKDNHLKMGLPGGKMEEKDGENPINTAIRETLEETGLSIFNLKLIFAIHKNGKMGYTYLADYEGEIKHDEPHVVKWLPYEALVIGPFGKYNSLVYESIKDFGVDVVYDYLPEEMIKELEEYINKTPYLGVSYKFKNAYKMYNWIGLPTISVSLQGEFLDLVGTLSEYTDFNIGLKIIGEKYGFIVGLREEYFIKQK
jgi:ADP-ribose pyrophosphatase YjhB (NUDIX family)